MRLPALPAALRAPGPAERIRAGRLSSVAFSPRLSSASASRCTRAAPPRATASSRSGSSARSCRACRTSASRSGPSRSGATTWSRSKSAALRAPRSARTSSARRRLRFPIGSSCPLRIGSSASGRRRNPGSSKRSAPTPPHGRRGKTSDTTSPTKGTFTRMERPRTFFRTMSGKRAAPT